MVAYQPMKGKACGYARFAALFTASSFRGAQSASPESIVQHQCGEMDSGLAPSGAPRNDDLRELRQPVGWVERSETDQTSS
jgi:hypothetical protein